MLFFQVWKIFGLLLTHSAQNCFSYFHQHFFFLNSKVLIFPAVTRSKDLQKELFICTNKCIRCARTERVCWDILCYFLIALCLDLWPFSPHICCGTHTLMNHIIHFYTQASLKYEVLMLSAFNKLLSVWSLNGLMVLWPNCTCYE